MCEGGLLLLLTLAMKDFGKPAEPQIIERWKKGAKFCATAAFSPSAKKSSSSSLLVRVLSYHTGKSFSLFCGSHFGELLQPPARHFCQSSPTKVGGSPQPALWEQYSFTALSFIPCTRNYLRRVSDMKGEERVVSRLVA